MRSIVEEALSRSKSTSPKAEIATTFSADDEELERILQGLKTNIKIIGCGGGGCNTVNRMVEIGIVGAEFYATNTDAQHLLTVHSPHKILLGRRTTRGLGAGAQPQIGEAATKENEEEIKALLEGTDIAFITCGLGGGTGTGSAPVIAEWAKEAGALTIAVCTSPFKAEGRSRMENAQHGLQRLRAVADTVVVVPNDKLVELVPRLSLNDAFKVADEVLVRSIKGITEIITKPGLVNLDFNDLKTIMQGAGVAMIGLGESASDDRAEEAVMIAMKSPLIDVDVSEANGALINVTGGNDMTISEAEKAAELVQDMISKDARIIWGAKVDPELQHTLKVMVVITGVKSPHIVGSEKAGPKGMDIVS